VTVRPTSHRGVSSPSSTTNFIPNLTINHSLELYFTQLHHPSFPIGVNSVRRRPPWSFPDRPPRPRPLIWADSDQRFIKWAIVLTQWVDISLKEKKKWEFYWSNESNK
jgi:hypothetical protein